MGRAAAGSSPALGIASVLLPHTPLRTPCSRDGDGPRGPPQSQSRAGSGRRLEDDSWCWEIACAWHGHSSGTAVPWHRPGQCHLPGGCLELLGEAGREGTGRDGEDWGGQHRGQMEEEALSAAKSLQVASVPARGGSVAGTEPERVPGPRQRLAPLPASTWGKGTGLAATATWPTASPGWHLPAPLPASSPGPAAARGPCKVTSLCGPLQSSRAEGKRVPESLHPSLQRRQPSLLPPPPISTGQLFHLSPPPPLQKIIIGPPHRTRD